MNVSDIMRTQVFFLSPSDTVMHAARELIVNDVESALVRDDDGKVVGLVSERDLLQAVLPNISELMEAGGVRDFNDILELCRSHSEVRIEAIMTTALQTVGPNMGLVQALGSMLAQRHRRLPVMDDGKAVGIVTQRDLLRHVFVYA